MNKNEGYPSTDELKGRERSFWANRMDEEHSIRSQYGSPEEREHEKTRVAQEWDKMERDKNQGLKDHDIWGNHLGRMTRMAESIRDAGKAERRARHLELAGLATAAKIFYNRAQQLQGGTSGKIDAQKDILIDNLEKFSGWVNHAAMHEYLEKA